MGQLFQVLVHVEAVSRGQRAKCTDSGSALALLNSAQLTFRKPLDSALSNARLFTKLADGRAVPAIEAGGPLLRPAQLGRVYGLKELVPAEVDS